MRGENAFLNCALEPGAINLRTAKKPPDGSDGFCANSLIKLDGNQHVYDQTNTQLITHVIAEFEFDLAQFRCLLE
jgi:hypothetical protein